MTYRTRADLIAQMEQIHRDIKKMNTVANAAARAQGYCDSWEQIMKKINRETAGRLGLKGRPGQSDVDYHPDAPPPPAAGIPGCDCEICRRDRALR